MLPGWLEHLITGLKHALNGFIRISPIHRNAPMTFPHILVFDSGLGGLTVLESLYTALPEGQYTYLADNAAFPYGALTEEILTARIVEVSDKLLPKIKPDILVIACSTASTLVLPSLRAQLSIPVVGVVPGIKPAASLSKTKLITLLATPATVDRPDTQSLIHTYAQDCLVNRVGSPVLALYSEAEFSHMPATDAQLLEAILPCFIHNTLGKTDVIVLGCTHYPLILHRLEALAPWPVTWVNPAPAIAKRVLSLLSQQGYTQTTGSSSLPPTGAHGQKRAIFTATPFSILHNSTFLSRFSFSQVGTEDIPFLPKTS